MLRIGKLVLAISSWLLMGPSAIGAEGDTLDAVKSRGSVNCGTGLGTSVGLNTLDDQGNWAGLEVELCRAIAAALLGDATKVNFVPLEFKNALTSLQSGSVDLLSLGATYTFSRDTELKLDVAGIYFYDGQGFMVPSALGVSTVTDLDGADVCVTSGSTAELNLADHFRTAGMTYTPIVARGREQHQANLEAGRCDAYTNEQGALIAIRTAFAEPDDYVVLADVISKEPIGLYVRQDDAAWRDVVSWTLSALILAEELGITAENVEETRRGSENPEVQRLLGVTGNFGSKLNLNNDWAVQVIRSVGNYGEIFERNLGKNSKIGLERGLNSLWTDGGLLYAPPFR